MRVIVPHRGAHPATAAHGIRVGRVEPRDPWVGPEPRLLSAGEASGRRDGLLLGLGGVEDAVELGQGLA